MTGLPVLAGPVEATAVGNLAIQLQADGQVADLDEIRAVIDRSFTVERHDPEPGTWGDDLYAEFLDHSGLTRPVPATGVNS